jgi:hypothetical protein
MHISGSSSTAIIVCMHTKLRRLDVLSESVRSSFVPRRDAPLYHTRGTRPAVAVSPPSLAKDE